MIEGNFKPFPNVEFQANLTEIASLQPDAVFAFFAGAGAVKFVKDYAEAGLKAGFRSMAPDSSPTGPCARRRRLRRGVFTTLHYADSLELPDATIASAPRSRNRSAAMPTSTRCRDTTRQSF